jgi:hypothetical protein
MKKSILLFVFILTNISCLAQEFRAESNLPAVNADGFYRIAISPEHTTHLNDRFTNIRIIDSKGAEVPYLFQVEQPSHHTMKFKPYNIVEKTLTKNCCTTLVLENSASEPINNISLSIKNADVTKQATLLGSDDKTNWFALKESFRFTPINNQKEISEVRIVDFPLSNYVYYKLQINDSSNAPINILSAGYFEVSTESGKFSQVPVQITTSDSIKQKQTFIKITLDTAHVIDKIQLRMKGAPYFLRVASINEQKERENKKGEIETWFDELKTFELSSKGNSVIDLPNTKINELIVIIENDDNPPLEVDEIKVFQLNRYLTAYLKKDESYTVKIGETDLRAPVYDIGYFKDSIPPNITTLSTGTLMMADQVAKSASKTFFSSKLIIWGAIIVVIIVLGFMAVRMINEASVEKN